MNNKKFFYVAISFIIFFFIIALTGIYRLGQKKTVSNGITVKQLENEKSEPFLQASSNNEEKVKPTARIKMTQHYKKCGHTTESEFFVPEEVVNMTKKQLEKYYFGWNIDEFSSSNITVSKECNSICDEHYVVRDVDGYIKVFCVDDNNKEKLVYGTEISTKYLPKDDREKLSGGIKIVGKENLSNLLEDYE